MLKSHLKSLKEKWRGTENKLLEIQCEVFTVRNDLWVGGVGPLCFLKSILSGAIY